MNAENTPRDIPRSFYTKFRRNARKGGCDPFQATPSQLELRVGLAEYIAAHYVSY